MRVAPYRDIGLVPNPRATEVDIAAAEARIGHTLPRSYRRFLSKHDGWPRFYEGATLLSASQLGHGLGKALSEAASCTVRFRTPARTSPKSFVVFGVDPQQTTLFAFNTLKRYPDGEFEVIAWLNELGLKYRGFPEFLAGIEELCLAELDGPELKARSA